MTNRWSVKARIVKQQLPFSPTAPTEEPSIHQQQKTEGPHVRALCVSVCVCGCVNPSKLPLCDSHMNSRLKPQPHWWCWWRGWGGGGVYVRGAEVRLHTQMRTDTPAARRATGTLILSQSNNAAAGTNSSYLTATNGRGATRCSCVPFPSSFLHQQNFVCLYFHSSNAPEQEGEGWGGGEGV